MTFIVPTLDYYFWEPADLRTFVGACESLRNLARRQSIALTVKLHPRYADHVLYDSLFECDGVNINVKSDTSLDGILDTTDVAVIAGISSAALEVASRGIPILWFCFYYPGDYSASSAPLGFFERHLYSARSIAELETRLLEMLTSASARQNAIERQKEFLTEALDCAGLTSALQIANIVEATLERFSRN